MFSAAVLAAAVSRAAPRARRAPLSLTGRAAERVKELLERRHKVRPRLPRRWRPGRARLALWRADLAELCSCGSAEGEVCCAGVPAPGCQEARLQRPGVHVELCR